MEEKTRRPGYLTDYARHAGISKQAAAKQLQRVGINYLESFDFDDADRLRAAMRHAARMPFSAEILLDDELDDLLEGAEGAQSKASPALAAVQLRKEEFRTKLLELEYRKSLGELVEKKTVREEAFALARTVRDAVLNVPSRVGGILAAESDRRRVEEILGLELRQALGALEGPDTPALIGTGAPDQT